VIDNDLWIGMLLVDTPAAACKTFRAHVRVVGLKDASDLAATTYTCIRKLELPKKTKGKL
jgi:hypothetical protein